MKMKKTKDIIIDFTSLLDVTMIILFFFILFSFKETEQVKSQSNEAVERAETMMQEAEKQQKEALKLNEEASKKLAELKESDLRGAENIQAIMDYSQGKTVRFFLDMNDSGWNLDVYFNDNCIQSIEKGNKEVISEKVMELLTQLQYVPENTILCQFVYDSEKPGTHSAYKAINGMLQLIQNQYEHLYWEETDLSIFTGEN